MKHIVTNGAPQQAPLPPGTPNCPGVGGHGKHAWLPGLGCPVSCTNFPGARKVCCRYINPAAGAPNEPSHIRRCTDFLTIDPFGPQAPEQPGDELGFAAVPTGEEDMAMYPGAQHGMNGHGAGCAPGCACPSVPPVVQTPGPDGRPIPFSVQPAPGIGYGLCWGVAGGIALAVPPATPTVIAINVQNYSWLKPRKLTITVADPASPANNPSRFVRVLSVLGVGRDVIGSIAGISGAAIDSFSENALMFGRDVPAITAANTIQVTVSHSLAAINLDISADIEGEAQQ